MLLFRQEFALLLIPCENVWHLGKNPSPKVILHGFLPATGTQ